MKPKHPSSKGYTPQTATSTKFTYSPKRILLTSNQIPSDYPYQLDKVVTKYQIPFFEFRASAPPPSDIGNPGDIWFELTRGSYALYAKTEPGDTPWVKWAGAYREKLVSHPELPNHALWVTLKNVGWYTLDGLSGDWSRKREERMKVGGYRHLDDSKMRTAEEVIRLLLLSESGAKTKVCAAKTSGKGGGKRRIIFESDIENGGWGDGLESESMSESESDDDDGNFVSTSNSRQRLRHTNRNAHSTEPCFAPAAAPKGNISAFHALLKAALGSDSCSDAELSNAQTAMIWTLTEGINYLLIEAKKKDEAIRMAEQSINVVDATAATARAKVVELEKELSDAQERIAKLISSANTTEHDKKRLLFAPQPSSSSLGCRTNSMDSQMNLECHPPKRRRISYSSADPVRCTLRPFTFETGTQNTSGSLSMNI